MFAAASPPSPATSGPRDGERPRCGRKKEDAIRLNEGRFTRNNEMVQADGYLERPAGKHCFGTPPGFYLLIYIPPRHHQRPHMRAR